MSLIVVGIWNQINVDHGTWDTQESKRDAHTEVPKLCAVSGKLQLPLLNMDIHNNTLHPVPSYIAGYMDQRLAS